MTTKMTPGFTIPVDKEISLSLPHAEEAEELFSLVDKNRAHLREFLGWVDFSRTASDTKLFIEENLPLWLELHSLHLSIRMGSKLIGAVGLHQVDFTNRSAFIGYWLDQDHQGMGIMTKSVKALMDYGIKELNLHRMQILCATHNTRSEGVAIRLGFTKEGILKDAIHYYGKFFNAYLYAWIHH
jgi:ribosomal-protein-serine acetyltransferase